MKIESLLSHFRQLVIQASHRDQITESDILKFAENRLEHHRATAMIAFLIDNPEIAMEIAMLRRLVISDVEQFPPSDLHRHVLRSLGLDDSCLMDIVLRKSNNVFRILTGQEFIIRLENQLAARTGEEDEIVFQTEKLPYFILCHIDHRDEAPSLYFSLRTTDKGQVKHGRFRVRKGEQWLFEILTDKMGITPPQTIEEGAYEIDVEVNEEKLGTIRLSLQG